MIELNLKSNHYVARGGFEPSAIYYISIKTQHSNNNFWTNLSACLGVLLTHFVTKPSSSVRAIKILSIFFFSGALSIEDEKFRELFNLLKPKVRNLLFFSVDE